MSYLLLGVVAAGRVVPSLRVGATTFDVIAFAGLATMWLTGAALQIGLERGVIRGRLRHLAIAVLEGTIESTILALALLGVFLFAVAPATWLVGGVGGAAVALAVGWITGASLLVITYVRAFMGSTRDWRRSGRSFAGLAVGVLVVLTVAQVAVGALPVARGVAVGLLTAAAIALVATLHRAFITRASTRR